MTEELDKKILFDNISYLLKKRDMKIGELETQVGVSLGYISRTSKEGNTKPGIDFIVNTAKVLGVSIDTLLRVNLSGLTPNEMYLIDFLEKLVRDTQEDKLDWQCETANYLNERLEIENNGEHPLFKSAWVDLLSGDGTVVHNVNKLIFFSRSFDRATVIAGDCYNLCMKNGAKLYLMNVVDNGGIPGLVRPPQAAVRELWMCPSNSEKYFLCGTGGTDELGSLLCILYAAIGESMKHPKVRKEIKTVIDAFMNDDWEDDVNDKYPSQFNQFCRVKSDEDIPF